MTLSFSQRKGKKPIGQSIQKEGMNPALRNSLWNVMATEIFYRRGFLHQSSRGNNPMIYPFSLKLWSEYFKVPIDQRPSDTEDILLEIRKYFFSCQWNEAYDFLEWLLNNWPREDVTRGINQVLERELSGYRFVSGVFTDITDSQEIQLLETAIEDKDFPGVSAHLRRSFELLSDPEKPDYRNSIKESISAVESLANVLTGKDKATLGDALSLIEREGKLHPALKESFSKLYGYTSDEGGVRHAMLEEPNLDATDAKFFLLSCTSFINYLKSKI